MNRYKQSFLDYTKQVWQPYYKEELTDSDSVEIITNMTDLVKLLLEWDEKDQKQNEARNKKADQQ